VEEGAECALRGTFWDMNALNADSASEFFQNLTRKPSKSSFLLPEGLDSAI
jgi:hypothetical protein